MESDQLLLTIFTGVCPSYWRSDMSSLRLPDTSEREMTFNDVNDSIFCFRDSNILVAYAKLIPALLGLIYRSFSEVAKKLV